MDRLQTSAPRATLLAGLTLAALLAASIGAQKTFGQGFLPHGYCFTWIPALLWINVISDVLIAAAYLSIPLTLAYFVRHRTDLPFSWVFVLFGVFIVACGATHALDVWTVWNPDYWLLGGVKAITAAASLPTAVALVWLMPKALAVPSADQLRKANDALRDEIAARALVEKRLEASQEELRRTVSERTSELKTTSALLDALFDSSPTCLAVFDSRLRFVKVNPTFAALSGLPPEQHWGRTFREVEHGLDAAIPLALAEVRDRVARVRQVEYETTRDGAAVRWRASIYAVPGTGADALIGYSAQVVP